MQDSRSSHDRGGVQAISRAAAILYSLEDAPEGLSLSALAANVGLPRSTVHRLVRALADEDLVHPGSGGGIRLGAGLARLGSAARSSVQHVVRPALAALRAQTGETVDLAVLEGARVRFVDQLPAEHRLRAVSAVGIDFPADCTANGKALLAALPLDTLRSLYPDADHSGLSAELEAVRKAGVAYDREEHSAGIWAVGAAITDPRGVPVAAISIPVPAARLDQREALLAQAVRRAAQEASELLSV